MFNSIKATGKIKITDFEYEVVKFQEKVEMLQELVVILYL